LKTKVEEIDKRMDKDASATTGRAKGVVIMWAVLGGVLGLIGVLSAIFALIVSLHK
jgi:hypothetical protein